MSVSTVYEISRPGLRAYILPKSDIPVPDGQKGFADLSADLPAAMKRGSDLHLPELSEPDVIRHYTELSTRAFGVDNGFYPLGSCTMKYNPRINEELAALEGFTDMHPLQDEDTVQGCLGLMYELTDSLCKITGMDAGTLQPCAGAQGEYTGLKIIRAWADAEDSGSRRTKMLVPQSAHGTNPASAAVNGFEVVQVAADSRGLVDIEDLKSKLGPDTAGIMLTNPNTLGLFEEDIPQISALVHEAGGLLYYDGANLNAVLGKARPGDMGFDVVHLNLHKTFSTPHGGGGPGSGPVLVKRELSGFLPVPQVRKTEKGYSFDWDVRDSVGKVSMFWGNFLVCVRAYAYILSMGRDGLAEAGETAVLNANYMLKRLSEKYDIPYGKRCMHEFVMDLSKLKEDTGVTAVDIAKALLDRGYHPPTMYFPLIVHEALMIEPTETESRETLDRFCDAMLELYDLAYSKPEVLKAAPVRTPAGRADEVSAAKFPCLKD